MNNEEKGKIKPHYIMLAALLYILVTWTACFLIDVRNVMGIRDAMINAGWNYPLWWYLFQEAGPTEILQWVALGAVSIACFRNFSRLRDGGGQRGAAMFWMLLGTAAALMFLEDFANIRHLLARVIIFFSEHGWSDQAGRQLRTVVELIYYVLLASLPVVALLRYGRHVWKTLRFPWYLLLGYGMYGIAGFASGSRYIFEWYYVAGSHFLEFLVSISNGPLLYVSTATLPMEFWLMDLFFEESLELLAAYALLAGIGLKQAVSQERVDTRGRDVKY